MESICTIENRVRRLSAELRNQYVIYCAAYATTPQKTWEKEREKLLKINEELEKAKKMLSVILDTEEGEKK